MGSLIFKCKQCHSPQTKVSDEKEREKQAENQCSLFWDSWLWMQDNLLIHMPSAMPSLSLGTVLSDCEPK